MGIKLALYKITHRINGDYIPFLAGVFLFVTFLMGMWLTFFGWTATVQASPLYELTDFHGPSLWGILALVVSLLDLSVLYTKNLKVANVTAFCGVLLWLYAGTVYLENDLWYQISVGALPNLLFWGWYWLQIKKAERA